jgi:hypothetical protein
MHNIEVLGSLIQKLFDCSRILDLKPSYFTLVPFNSAVHMFPGELAESGYIIYVCTLLVLFIVRFFENLGLSYECVGFCRTKSPNLFRT